MNVVYSDAHAAHAPAHQITAEGPAEYFDVPQRAEAILAAVRSVGLCEIVPAKTFGVGDVAAIHDRDYIDYLAGAYKAWVSAGLAPVGVIPDCLAHRSMRRRPAAVAGQAGYYCFDTAAPIVEGTFSAAMASASCALTAAELLLGGTRRVYALCRPPGHHAGRDYCGGFCYLNNAALAAVRLGRDASKVAILDVDYHHGNGTQSIFYASSQVLYASLHADPNVEYPYFAGYADETGMGEGLGCNFNFPLPLGTDEPAWLTTLDRALGAISDFGAVRLVVSLGADTLADDPVGQFALTPDTFSLMADRIGRLGLPTLVVQEGGYDLTRVGSCVANFLSAL